MQTKTRKKLSSKDTKLLWGNAANTCSKCKRKVEHRNKLSINPNVLVGIQAHIVAHSPGGARGEEFIEEMIRDKYENLILVCAECSKIIDDQKDIYTSEKLRKMKENHENEIQQKLLLPTNKFTTIPSPIVNISGSGGSGGPNGHFINITFKNLSDDTALDCRPYIKGFGININPPTHKIFNLDSRNGLQSTKEVVFRIDNQPFFTKEWPELKIGVEYINTQDQKIKSETDLIQKLSKGGEIYNFCVGNYKVPTFKDSDEWVINFIQLLDSDIDGSTALFNVIHQDGKNQTIKLSISGSLLSVCDISTIDFLIAAFKELGERKIKQMIMTNDLKDYMFTTYDKQNNTAIGFERYKSLRDSI